MTTRHDDDDVVDDATSFPGSLLPVEMMVFLLVAKCCVCLFVCVHVPCSKMPKSGSKSERNPAFSFFRSCPLAQALALTRPGYQASKASTQLDTSSSFIAAKNCKASQKKIVVPLQNCIAVYNDSETPSK